MDAPKSADAHTAIGELEARRRRARYRAWHRGTREMDLVLGPYADAHVPRLGLPELVRLEALLEEIDTDLLKWVMRQEPLPATADRELIEQLIAFHQTVAASK